MKYKDLEFKGWLKKEKEFVSIASIDFHNDKINYMNKEGLYKQKKKVEDIELLMFTGCYDKHNKPVYEGDLIEHVKDGIGEVVWLETKGFAVAVHEDDGEHLFYLGAGLGITHFKDTEIVGNKFEDYALFRKC